MKQVQPTLPEFVDHPKWGVGRVIGSDGNYCEVFFLAEGRKRFTLAYAMALPTASPAQGDVEALMSKSKGMSYAPPGAPEPVKKPSRGRSRRSSDAPRTTSPPKAAPVEAASASGDDEDEEAAAADED